MTPAADYSVFDGMIEGVQVISRDWKYIYVNDAVARQGKYSRSELLGHTMMEKYPGIEHTELFSVLRRCMEGQVVDHMENEFEFPDKSKGYFELRIQPVPEGISILSRDITKKKRAEQAIVARNRELQKINAELEQFVYIASHDLQEPLRTVTSYIGLLHKKYAGRLDGEADKYLRFISEAAGRMKALIKGLLDYSLLGQKGVPAQVDCTELVAGVIRDLSAVIRESGAAVHAEKLPRLEAYETELRQLFQNLIANAIKFRRPGVQPEIAVTAERQPGRWLFRVRDNGIGMEAKHTKRIFTIFQRLHPAGEYEGTGIGLAHCRKIAELHGGEIGVNSVPGGGSTFFFTIPDKITKHERKA